ncbi:hypothetical protein EJB05_23006, partial [Eragrostis curvula]
MQPGPPPMRAVLAVEQQPEESSEYKLRKQLLLLAMLVVSVTYVAGLNPPGGIWQEDGPDRETAGDPILRFTHYGRYLAFYYCNAAALAASLVVIFLLLLKHPNKVQLAVLRLVMVLDLLALMGAYLAGASCRERPATVYTAALVLALSAYVGVHILQNLAHSDKSAVGASDDDAAAEQEGAAATVVLRPKERRKVLLLLATFAAAITYVAGLNPPGGFWDTPDGAAAVKKGGAHRYRPGDSLMEAHHGGHFRMFFYCNTTTFVASLFIIVLLLEQRLGERSSRSFALQVFLLGALLGLLAAYAAGSCRYTDSSVYVVSLLGAVLGFIFLAMLCILSVKHLCVSPRNNTTADDADNDSVVSGQTTSPGNNSASNGGSFNIVVQGSTPNPAKEATEKVKSLVLLLANLAATITYQAGLDPPGGFWPETRHGHKAGDAILLSSHPTRYAVFFYCNSVAFVASLVAILMVQNVRLVKSNTLLVAMMLDMFALIGAYAAGSCRDVETSVHVVAVAGAVLVYVLVHVLFGTLGSADTDGNIVAVVEKKHKRLLLLAILVATITYQVGLTPPGGFWVEDDPRRGGHIAGDAVLLDNFPRRYNAFFYCNTASFMASIALVLLLVNPNFSKLAIRCYALYACQVAGLLSLLGAYAAGSARSLRTSVFVCLLVAAVIAFIVVLMMSKGRGPSGEEEEEAAAAAESPSRHRHPDETKYRDEVYAKRKYLMLLGILAASVTYQAGLAPPGGLWQDDGRGGRREAGNPVMHDMDPHRYHVFFYSNSTSFVASVVVIALLLQQILRRHRQHNHNLLLLATNTAVVLDLLGLLAAYAAGSTRHWRSVALLPLLVLAFMVIHVAVWLFGERRRCGRGAGAASNDGRQPGTEEQVANGHGQPSQSPEAV